MILFINAAPVDEGVSKERVILLRSLIKLWLKSFLLKSLLRLRTLKKYWYVECLRSSCIERAQQK